MWALTAHTFSGCHRETLRYGEDGTPKGLMGEHKVLLLQAGGSVYSEGWYVLLLIGAAYWFVNGMEKRAGQNALAALYADKQSPTAGCSRTCRSAVSGI